MINVIPNVFNCFTKLQIMHKLYMKKTRNYKFVYMFFKYYINIKIKNKII